MMVSPDGKYLLELDKINDNGMEMAIFVDGTGRLQYYYYLEVGTVHLDINLAC